MIDRLFIAGGKTGGHLYPGIAVAEEILRRNPQASVTFIGTTEGLESRVLPRLGYALETITASRLVGGGWGERVRGLLKVPVAMMQTWRLLRTLRPQVVLGVGGYASGPALLAAWLGRVPTAIQEQNATPGFTNRMLGRLVAKVYVGFEATARHFRPEQVVTTGNPVRRALVDELAKAARDREQAASGRTLSVLVFGGSQGARFLNERVPGMLASLAASAPGVALHVLHQTGVHDEEITRARYDAAALEDRVTVVPYIDDMPAAYAEADVAICRAGALTVAELTAVGMPSLLVPFPFAAAAHQEANAQVLVDAEAGLMVRQENWNDDEVARWLASLDQDRSLLDRMSKGARDLARPAATRTLVDHLEELAA